MSDGPHRSLPLPKRWKVFAERVSNPAYSPEETTAALTDALVEDCRSVNLSDHIARLRSALFDRQTNLFDDELPRVLETLRSEAPGDSLANVFLDTVAGAVQPYSVNETMFIAVLEAIRNQKIRRARQIEEHYHRNPENPVVLDIRERIDTALREHDERTLARRLVDGDRVLSVQKSARRQGLDDGVSI